MNLPTPMTFLSMVLNCSIPEVETTAEAFTFSTVPSSDVKFFLYPKIKTTSTNRTYTEITNESIDLTKPTKIIVHGWQSNGTTDFIIDMANKYNKYYNYTIISLDWSKHSQRDYIHSAQSTQGIGYLLGEFILKSINANTKLLGNIHLIGHSLGAHVSGVAGQYIIGKTGKKISRITGLDAALPLFELPLPLPENRRISQSDATFVDTIHTNAGFLGVVNAFGDVDFYVNFGGPVQPGCFNPSNIFETFTCSHSKSHEYYIQTLIGKRFQILPCPKLLHSVVCKSDENMRMGEDVPKSAFGIYFVDAGE